MDTNGRAIEAFHPLVQEWFTRRYGASTEVQEQAWPVIARGDHVLVAAPTGTGKTYTAFLWALDRLIRGVWEPGATRVLYVSPLKALNTDIRENLLRPLEELRRLFGDRGVSFPRIDVQTRSGDTPGPERQRMIRTPPEILITTPESLNLILSSPRAREMLSGIRTAIIDEIHAVLGTKRGTHLITAVDRLVVVAGEFQRIGLSATVRPLEQTAEFLGGYIGRRANGEWVYERRDVRIIRSTMSKEVSVAVSTIGRPEQTPPGDTHWQLLSRRLKEIVRARRSTLIFVNNRRLAERLAHLINEGEQRLIAYAHHGSLSKELRGVVEQRLRSGELSAIVATSSLELGIDIGDLDEVVLVETPFGVAQALQRLGRAGHSVGLASRGVLFPSHGIDLMHAAVLSGLVRAKDIEELHPIIGALDVLAQVIVSMVGVEPWRLDDLYGRLRTSYPYHNLARREFDSVVEMLEGKYADSRIRELHGRVSVDRAKGIIRAREGALFLLYSGGGTIPDRGYFSLHVADSDARIGELDEEFVWERKVGDTFALGTQQWRIASIDHQKVKVVPWKGAVNILPFWRAETSNRDSHFSTRIAEALERWDECLERFGPIRLVEELREREGLEPESAEALASFLRRQREATRVGLPHRHRIVVEHTGTKGGLREIVIHTLWGGRVNYPLRVALSALIAREFTELDLLSDNDTIAVVLPAGAGADDAELDAGELLRRLASEDVEALLRSHLESSGFFGARFRENAGRALLLPKPAIGRRMPLWVTRLRSKRLFDRVRRYGDFPITVETWRTCIRDEFDLPALHALLSELRSGSIEVAETATAAPSPFCSSVLWTATGSYVYSDDGNTRAEPTSLSDELLKEVVFSDALRVKLKQSVVESFTAKLQRTAPGYAPRSAHELIDWLKERLLIPAGEWAELLDAVIRDHGLERTAIEEVIAPRIVRLPEGFVAADELDKVRGALSGDSELLERVLRQWLQFYGPVREEQLAPFGAHRVLHEVITALVEERAIVRDFLTEGAVEAELCDAENLERLLAFSRRDAMPHVEALPPGQLQLYLAEWQGLLRAQASPVEPESDATARDVRLAEADGADDPGAERAILQDPHELLRSIFDQLFGLAAPAELWERELLPSRMPRYRGTNLDELLRSSDLEWFGCGARRVAFRLSSDADLFRHDTHETGADNEPAKLLTELFTDRAARYDFWALHGRSGLATNRFTELVWSAVWGGSLLCDSFEALRRGIRSNFVAESAPPRAEGGGRRGGFARWKASRPISGAWYLAPEAPEVDLLDEQELAKERARQLLGRYGILFRELLSHELPALRWSALFRTLRLMELSGELLSGSFFEGIPGLQFISHSGLRAFRNRAGRDLVYWMNAADPASLCGSGLFPELELPSRLPSTHLVFHDERLVVVSRRNCRELEIRVPAESTDLPRYFALFRHLMTRDFEPIGAIKVERVNGVAVRSSPYAAALVREGFSEDFKAYTFWAR